MKGCFVNRAKTLQRSEKVAHFISIFQVVTGVTFIWQSLLPNNVDFNLTPWENYAEYETKNGHSYTCPPSATKKTISNLSQDAEKF